MDQVKFVENSLQKILHGPFLNTLTQITINEKKTNLYILDKEKKNLWPLYMNYYYYYFNIQELWGRSYFSNWIISSLSSDGYSGCKLGPYRAFLDILLFFTGICLRTTQNMFSPSKPLSSAITSMEKQRTANRQNINLPTVLQLIIFNYIWINFQVFISHVSGYWSFYYRFSFFIVQLMFPQLLFLNYCSFCYHIYPLPF